MKNYTQNKINRVLKYAYSHSPEATAQKYTIAESTLYRWLAQSKNGKKPKRAYQKKLDIGLGNLYAKYIKAQKKWNVINRELQQAVTDVESTKQAVIKALG